LDHPAVLRLQIRFPSIELFKRGPNFSNQSINQTDIAVVEKAMDGGAILVMSDRGCATVQEAEIGDSAGGKVT
jgi:hypothetical protein